MNGRTLEKSNIMCNRLRKVQTEDGVHMKTSFCCTLFGYGINYANDKMVYLVMALYYDYELEKPRKFQYSVLDIFYTI